MLSQYEMDALKQIAKGIAGHFGSSCEVVIHELSERSADSSIVAIENGHVSGRKAGDGPSHIVLEQLGQEDPDADAGRQDPEILLHLHPRRAGKDRRHPRDQF